MDSRFEELYTELMEVEVDKEGAPIFYWRLDEEYRSTIACDFAIKILEIDNNEIRL